MRVAEAQGKFSYSPESILKDIDYEEKEKPVTQRIEVTKTVPVVPSPSAVPLIPAVVSTTSASQPSKSLLPDEFLDPELDLELEGINLDGDGEVNTCLNHSVLLRILTALSSPYLL